MKLKKDKFAIVHPSLAIKGGAENVVVWLAEALAQRGYQVDLITTDYDYKFFGSPKKKGFKLILLPALEGYVVRPINWFRNGHRLKKILEKYDYINSHNFPAYIWVYFAKVFNRKINGLHIWFCEEPVRSFYEQIINKHINKVLGVDSKKKDPKTKGVHRILHNMKSHKLGYPLFLFRAIKTRTNHSGAKWLDLRIVPRLDLVITNSEFIAGMVKKIFKIRAHAGLLGIPVERFITSGKIRYESYSLTVSRLGYSKNLFNTIRAIKILRDKKCFSGRKHVIAGGGELYDDLEKFIQVNSLEKQVSLLGFVSEKQLSQLYRNTDLVIYLTLDETYGLPFPEAGLYKKAVIGPNHGGPSELVIDGKTGYQVDPLDPQTIASGIKKILLDPNRLKKMGEANYKHVMNNLTFDKFVERFLKVVKKYDK